MIDWKNVKNEKLVLGGGKNEKSRRYFVVRLSEQNSACLVYRCCFLVRVCFDDNDASKKILHDEQQQAAVKERVL